MISSISIFKVRARIAAYSRFLVTTAFVCAFFPAKTLAQEDSLGNGAIRAGDLSVGSSTAVLLMSYGKATTITALTFSGVGFYISRQQIVQLAKSLDSVAPRCVPIESGGYFVIIKSTILKEPDTAADYVTARRIDSLGKFFQSLGMAAGNVKSMKTDRNQYLSELSEVSDEIRDLPDHQSLSVQIICERNG